MSAAADPPLCKLQAIDNRLDVLYKDGDKTAGVTIVEIALLEGKYNNRYECMRSHAWEAA